MRKYHVGFAVAVYVLHIRHDAIVLPPASVVSVPLIVDSVF